MTSSRVLSDEEKTALLEKFCLDDDDILSILEVSYDLIETTQLDLQTEMDLNENKQKESEARGELESINSLNTDFGEVEPIEVEGEVEPIEVEAEDASEQKESEARGELESINSLNTDFGEVEPIEVEGEVEPIEVEAEDASEQKESEARGELESINSLNTDFGTVEPIEVEGEVEPIEVEAEDASEQKESEARGELESINSLNTDFGEVEPIEVEGEVEPIEVEAEDASEQKESEARGELESINSLNTDFGTVEPIEVEGEVEPIEVEAEDASEQKESEARGELESINSLNTDFGTVEPIEVEGEVEPIEVEAEDASEQKESEARGELESINSLNTDFGTVEPIEVEGEVEPIEVEAEDASEAVSKADDDKKKTKKRKREHKSKSVGAKKSKLACESVDIEGECSDPSPTTIKNIPVEEMGTQTVSARSLLEKTSRGGLLRSVNRTRLQTLSTCSPRELFAITPFEIFISSTDNSLEAASRIVIVEGNGRMCLLRTIDESELENIRVSVVTYSIGSAEFEDLFALGHCHGSEMIDIPPPTITDASLLSLLMQFHETYSTSLNKGSFTLQEDCLFTWQYLDSIFPKRNVSAVGFEKYLGESGIAGSKKFMWLLWRAGPTTKEQVLELYGRQRTVPIKLYCAQNLVALSSKEDEMAAAIVKDATQSEDEWNTDKWSKILAQAKKSTIPEDKLKANKIAAEAKQKQRAAKKADTSKVSETVLTINVRSGELAWDNGSEVVDKVVLLDYTSLLSATVLGLIVSKAHTVVLVGDAKEDKTAEWRCVAENSRYVCNHRHIKEKGHVRNIYIMSDHRTNYISIQSKSTSNMVAEHVASVTEKERLAVILSDA